MKRPGRIRAVVWKQTTMQVNRMEHPANVGDFIREARFAYLHGLTSIGIDLSKVTVAFPNVCAPIAGTIEYYRGKGISFNSVGTVPAYLQRTALLSPLTVSANVSQATAACLDRVWRFSTSDEVQLLVSCLVKELSKSIACEAGVIEAVEWSANEVMDNVLQHSGVSRGYMMAQVHPNAKHAALCVFDHGIGIYNTLRGTQHAPRNPADAISLAIKEGVTRDTAIGQGNGLWGLHNMVRMNRGKLTITTAGASWQMTGDTSRVYDKIPFLSREDGATVVDFQLDTQSPISISEALTGETKAFTSDSLYLDEFLTESRYLLYSLRDQASGTGTRNSGERIRNELLNIQKTTAKPIVIDFAGISVVSSSFADELIGKMVLILGFMNFNHFIRMTGMNDVVQAIVNRSVAQRMSESL